MNSALHELLVSCDVKDAWEFPPGIDYRDLVAEIEKLQPEIERLLETKLQLDKNIQDASFFADLGVLVQQQLERGVINFMYEVCFRFSSFSKLYSLFGENFATYKTEAVKTLLLKHGFIYVPADELDEPYDGINGSNKPYEGKLTWWTRYFDYL